MPVTALVKATPAGRPLADLDPRGRHAFSGTDVGSGEKCRLLSLQGEWLGRDAELKLPDARASLGGKSIDQVDKLQISVWND